jgi:hypothetical protein
MCSGEPIVYTEDVGSSSLSSPTTNYLDSIGFGGHFTKFPVGLLNSQEIRHAI